MVSELILARWLGHSLLGCYRTTLKQYTLTHELNSLSVRGCVADLTLTRDKVELGLNFTSWYSLI